MAYPQLAVTVSGSVQVGSGTITGGGYVMTCGSGGTFQTYGNSTISSGSYYFEVTVPATTCCLGIGAIRQITGALGPNPFYTGEGADVANFDGHCFINSNTTSVNLGTWVAGDVLCVAVQAPGLVWFRRNNGYWNSSATANPSTGTGGLPLLAEGLYPPLAPVFYLGTAGAVLTVNFGQTAFAQTSPTGFGTWPIASSTILTPVNAGTITVPIYDAPYTITPPCNNGYPNQPNVGPGALVPIVYDNDIENYYISTNNNPQQSTQSSWSPRMYVLGADTYYTFGSSATGTGGPPSPSFRVKPFYFVNGKFYSCWLSGNSIPAYADEQYLWEGSIPFGESEGSYTSLGLLPRVTYLASHSQACWSYNEGFPFVPAACATLTEGGLPQWSIVAIQWSVAGTAANVLVAGWSLATPLVPTTWIAAQNFDSTYSFNFNYEYLWGAFTNVTIKNNYLGAPCSPNGDANVWLSVLYAPSSGPGQNYNLYGYTPGQQGAFFGTVESIPNLSTIRNPSALCTLGFLWQSEYAGIYMVLSPDGSKYWTLNLVGQSANAQQALASGYGQAPAPTVLGDADGNIWVLSNWVGSETFTYVGLGSLNVLELTPPEPLTPGTPMALPCFNPCNLLMGPHQ